MTHFNILLEPWIPIVYNTGEERLVSLKQCLLEAHNILRLDASRLDSKIFEYALYRFLVVFVMDMIFDGEADRTTTFKSAFGQGRLSEEAIDEYVALCEAGGTSFDFFDEKRPFLQCKDEERLPESYTGNIAKISPVKKTGNSDVFYNTRAVGKVESKKVEEAHKVDITNAITMVLYSHVLRVASGGYTATYLGYAQMPIMMAPEAGNLFTSIFLGMGEKASPKDVPMWRWPDYFDNGFKKEVQNPYNNSYYDNYGFLTFAFYPAAFIRVLPSEDEYIHKVRVRKIVYEDDEQKKKDREKDGKKPKEEFDAGTFENPGYAKVASYIIEKDPHVVWDVHVKGSKNNTKNNGGEENGSKPYVKRFNKSQNSLWYLASALDGNSSRQFNTVMAATVYENATNLNLKCQTTDYFTLNLFACKLPDNQDSDCLEYKYSYRLPASLMTNVAQRRACYDYLVSLRSSGRRLYKAIEEALKKEEENNKSKGKEDSKKKGSEGDASRVSLAGTPQGTLYLKGFAYFTSVFLPSVAKHNDTMALDVAQEKMREWATKLYDDCPVLKTKPIQKAMFRWMVTTLFFKPKEEKTA